MIRPPSAFQLRPFALVMLAAIAFGPIAGAGIADQRTPSDEARTERAASDAMKLAQRCFYYKGQLRCF